MTNRVPGGGVPRLFGPPPRPSLFQGEGEVDAQLAAKRIGDAAEIPDLKLLGAALGIDAKPLQQCLGIWRDLSQGGAEHLAPLAEGCRRHALERGGIASGLRDLLGHELNE